MEKLLTELVNYTDKLYREIKSLNSFKDFDFLNFESFQNNLNVINTDFTNITNIDVLEEAINSFYPYQIEIIEKIPSLNNVKNCSDEIENIVRTIYKLPYDAYEKRFAMLVGDPGVGKSHFLADFAYSMIKDENLVMMQLGQSFNSSKSIEEVFIERLGLRNILFEDLLFACNEQIKINGKSRMLIIIDALNEAENRSVWNNELPTFIAKVKQYENISVCLSCTPTSFEILENTLNISEIIKIPLEGFFRPEEQKYAIKKYLEEKGIPYSSSTLPFILQNPLLLSLYAESCKDNKFNLHDENLYIADIIEKYFYHIQNSLIQKEPFDSIIEPNSVFKACKDVAKQILSNGGNSISLEEGRKICGKYFNKKEVNSSGVSWLECLISKNLFKPFQEYPTNECRVKLTFNLIENHLMIDTALEGVTKEKLNNLFIKGGILEGIFDSFNSKQDLLYTLFIKVKEKYNIELFEIKSIKSFLKINLEKKRKVSHKKIAIIFKSFIKNIKSFLGLKPHIKEIDNLESFHRTFIRSFLDGLVSRKNYLVDLKAKESFRKLFIKTDKHERYNYLYILIELSTRENNLLNSNFLNDILFDKALPERDNFWTIEINSLYFEGNRKQSEGILKSILDKSLSKDLSKLYNKEELKLLANLLTWLLSSNKRTMRDIATKVLVNIFSYVPQIYSYIIEKFQNIDDLYILERIVAAGIGAIVRLQEKEDISSIAKSTYDYIFKQGYPPPHILLRKYAQDIIRYALFKKINLNININLCNPPYNSKFTLDNIPNDKLEQFENNMPAIFSSSTSGDFERYILGGNWSEKHFFNIRLNDTSIKALFDPIKTGKVFENAFENCINSPEDEKLLDLLTNKINTFSTKENENNNKIKEMLSQYITVKQIKEWIINRCNELGWTKELFESYERSYIQYNSRSRSDIERIGKKYQWLAYYEIMAHLADHYYCVNKSDYTPYTREKIPYIYKGNTTFDIVYPDLAPSVLQSIELKNPYN